MRIASISECHVGSAWAHAINVIKTSGGFARLGHEVTLLCRAHPEGDDPRARLAEFGEPSLPVETAPPSVAPDDPAAFAAWAVGRAEALGVQLCYCRHFLAPVLAARRGLPVAMETHAYAGDRNPALLGALGATRDPLAPIDAVITIHPTLRDYYITAGADPARVHVVPDGVDAHLFTPPAALPPAPWSGDAPDRPRVVYAGRLFAYKGVDTLVHAAAMLPGWIIELLGDPEEERRRLERLSEELGVTNVRFQGRRPLAEVPRWLWHARALVLAPSAKEPSAAWTSPVKLGEYLAAGPPIVASDIPGLREWVDEPAVRWTAPDDAAALARAIERCGSESAGERAARRAVAAELVRQYAYEQRARRIMEAVGRTVEFHRSVRSAVT